MKRVSGFSVLSYTVISLFSLACVLPLLLVLMVSISDESSIMKNGYQFIPEQFSFVAYSMLFHDGSAIFRSYGISIFITVVGSIAALVITAMAAYTLANEQVKFRNGMALYFFITMVIGAGIVPWYIVCTRLGLSNNLLALIIPNLIFNPFNMFLVRNFMKGIPVSLKESAKIDGAGDIYILFRIYFPLCIPVLAAVSLFYALGYWNDWWNAIMLVENKSLYPLQYLLFRLQSELQMLSNLQVFSANQSLTPPTESLKMATAITTIGPIVLLYPFLQRYFVKGLIIGSVKE
ncbi:carbohydrate ABC transporter permease [Paenibacillus silvisoli]|uniref:carbohydrate ABC transporter permease n=1 Tax=Paenibacillus silvisoli TaxID=3110539 RepID=UPI002805112D|nr:carbohydrate ABC transporter permease [Paenibacillus silvisoli]